MKKYSLTLSLFAATLLHGISSQAQATPQRFATAMRTAGVFAAANFMTHEGLNLPAFSQKPNIHRHTAFAMTTTGCAALSGMYLKAAIPASLPMGGMFLGMAAWGQYLSYKQHHQVDTDDAPEQDDDL